MAATQAGIHEMALFCRPDMTLLCPVSGVSPGQSASWTGTRALQNAQIDCVG